MNEEIETSSEKWARLMEHDRFVQRQSDLMAKEKANIVKRQEEQPYVIPEPLPREKTYDEFVDRMYRKVTKIIEGIVEGIVGWDPVLMSLVRKAMPNLIAYDITGVQPMTGPTGLIFAMKTTDKSKDESLFQDEPVIKVPYGQFRKRVLDKVEVELFV
jgi:hypothetical protein